jgi:carboxymethylenebutenolidase
MGEQIMVQAGDETVAGYLAVPDSGEGPAVLVLHAWWGLTPVFTAVCDRLAGEGFVAFAPDLNAGRIAETIEAAKSLMKTRDNQRTEAAALGGLEFLQTHPAVAGSRLGIVGFSMGAAWGLEISTARPAAVAAAVIFYGAYAIDFSAAEASYLGHFAENDEWESPEDVQLMAAALREAGRELALHVYPGTAHWFFEPDRPEYDPAAAALAWERTVAFLRERLTQS